MTRVTIQKVMPTLPVSELRTHQAQVLARLQEGPVLLTQRGRGAGVLVHPDQWNKVMSYLEQYEAILGLKGPVTQLLSSSSLQPRKAGSAKHLDIHISDDFDEPLEDFAEYM